jgi:hypothetical protein
LLKLNRLRDFSDLLYLDHLSDLNYTADNSFCPKTQYLDVAKGRGFV